MPFYDRDRIRRVFWALTYWTGALRLWRFLRRNRVTILTVHGVMDTEEPVSWVPLRPQLSRQVLEKNLRCLSRYYHFVSLQDAVAMLTGKVPVQPYSLVLTFDDGYRNNLKHALPILRRYQAPATFFVTTGNIEQRRPFWFDRLDYVLQCADIDGRSIEIGNTPIHFHSKDRHLLRESYRELREAAKAMSQDLEMQRELEAFAESLERNSGHRLADIWEEDDWSAVLNWSDVRTAISQSVTIGSHTVDHIRLGLVEGDVARHQLMRSKEMIEAQTGLPCRYFCYPNGSTTPAVAELVRECGYDAAVTAEEGSNSIGTDLMTLRRVDLPTSINPVEVLVKVSGLSVAFSRSIIRLRTLLFQIMKWFTKGR